MKGHPFLITAQRIDRHVAELEATGIERDERDAYDLKDAATILRSRSGVSSLPQIRASQEDTNPQ